jgi:hypothetical protein
MDERQLWEKLARIEALFAGATTAGERAAAGAARERIRARLRAEREVQPHLYQFSLHDPWERRLFVALLRRYELEPFRLYRQRFSTVMVRAPRPVMDETVWPEFKELSRTLRAYLSDVTERVIREVLESDGTEAAVRREPPALSGGVGDGAGGDETAATGAAARAAPAEPDPPPDGGDSHAESTLCDRLETPPTGRHPPGPSGGPSADGAGAGPAEPPAHRMTRITFRLPSDAGFASETVWAEALAPGRFRLWNIPFHAQGYARFDIVEATPDRDGIPTVRRVIIRSMHATYWVHVEEGVKGNAAFGTRWAPLQALGCEYEGWDGHGLAVDVPAGVDLAEIEEHLDLGVRDEVWRWQAACRPGRTEKRRGPPRRAARRKVAW